MKKLWLGLGLLGRLGGRRHAQSGGGHVLPLHELG